MIKWERVQWHRRDDDLLPAFPIEPEDSHGGSGVNNLNDKVKMRKREKMHE